VLDLTPIIALAREQDGIVSNAQAADLGLTPSARRNAIDRRGWRRPFYGILFVPEASKDVDRSRARAAAMRFSEGVVSQRSAARFWGLEGLPRRHHSEPVFVTLPRTSGCRQPPGVALTWQALAPDDVVNVDGILVTTPARTLQDLARTESREVAVCVAESAVRKALITPEELAALPAPVSPSPWLLVDPLAQTPIETLVRLPLVDAEIGPLVSQYEVTTSSGITLAAIDLALPLYRIGLEADGREGHDDDKAFVWDRRRDVLLAEDGWIIIRFSWQDALRPAYVLQTVNRAIDRVRRQYALGR
jgi:very-short-patch-repair endonuclease